MRFIILTIFLVLALASTTVNPTTTVGTTTVPENTTQLATTTPSVGLTDGQIAGIVVGSFAGVILILVVIACIIQNNYQMNNRGAYRNMRR